MQSWRVCYAVPRHGRPTSTLTRPAFSNRGSVGHRCCDCAKCTMPGWNAMMAAALSHFVTDEVPPPEESAGSRLILWLAACVAGTALLLYMRFLGQVKRWLQIPR